MSIRRRTVGWVTALLAASIPGWSTPASLAEEPERLVTMVDRVTIYPDLVSLQRATSLEISAAGTRLVGVVIPGADGVDRDSVRVTARGAGTVTSVDLVEIERTTEAAADLQDLRDELMLAELERDGIESDLALFESIASRLADRTAAEFGTLDFDPDLARRQLEALRSDRSELMRTLLERTRELEDLRRRIERTEARNAASSRAADLMVVVDLTADAAGSTDLVVRYRRSDAGWRPVYSFRSSSAGDVGLLEYDAEIVQATGEDWRNVEVVLSTARPSAPRMPPSLRPVFVDRIRVPAPDDVAFDSMMVDPPTSLAVDQVGTALQFTLPGAIDVPSDADGSTRASITEIQTPIDLVRVAIPVIDDRVFVRADAVNESNVSIVPGEVALYFDDEYVGVSSLEAVQPNAAFEVWLGPDPSIRTARLVLDRETERTGLLGGGRQTNIETRIELQHLGPGSVEVEVWDRRPTSRDEDIEVSVGEPTPALATDESYRRTEARMGLLKWLITLGPEGSDAATREIVWTLRVNRSADIDMTPIPE